MEQSYKFYKKHESDLIWWVDNFGVKVGIHEFSFDKKKIFNMFRDYPHELTPEQKEIFDRENPNWAKRFSYRPYPKKEE